MLNLPVSRRVALLGAGVGLLSLLSLGLVSKLRATAAPSLPAARTPSSAAPAAPLRKPGRPRRGGLDVTFLVTSDTHFGYRGPLPGHPEEVDVATLNGAEIDAMNALPGTPWPAALSGRIGAPSGVLVAGDLTETGQAAELALFNSYYGLDGHDGRLHYPVFEALGNHDAWGGKAVRAEVSKRHGDARYAWDWGDLHVVCLGEGPNFDDLAWLARDLEAQGPEVGVVLFFHYPLQNAETYWFREPFKAELERVLAGYRVLGILNGHTHTSGAYRWRGYDAYIEGSVKGAWHSFSVVHVTDERWTVASYNYDKKAFWWWHQKPIFGAPGESRAWFSPTDKLVRPD